MRAKVGWIGTKRPLSGIRLLNLATKLPGPIAAAHLCDMGADVTKIEPAEGDLLEEISPQWYERLHTNQKVIRLNLKKERDRTKFDDLLGGADLLLTAMRPPALRRLSLDWRTLHSQYPRLCHVGVFGYPPPMQNLPGHDLTYQASGGLVCPPLMPITLFTDMASGERLVSAALALLLFRARTNEGGQAQVAMTTVAEDLATPRHLGLTLPGASLGGKSPFYNIYKAKTGWIAVAALEPHFAKRLVEGLRVKGIDQESLGSAFATRSADHWQRWASRHDIPLVKVRDVPIGTGRRRHPD
jgi:alpha-methylacyl-CoA racemase